MEMNRQNLAYALVHMVSLKLKLIVRSRGESAEIEEGGYLKFLGNLVFPLAISKRGARIKNF